MSNAWRINSPNLNILSGFNFNQHPSQPAIMFQQVTSPPNFNFVSQNLDPIVIDGDEVAAPISQVQQPQVSSTVSFDPTHSSQVQQATDSPQISQQVSQPIIPASSINQQAQAPPAQMSSEEFAKYMAYREECRKEKVDIRISRGQWMDWVAYNLDRSNRLAPVENPHQWGWWQLFNRQRRSQGLYEFTDQQAVEVFVVSESAFTPNIDVLNNLIGYFEGKRLEAEAANSGSFGS